MGSVNPLFHDYPKFVYQTPDVIPLNEQMQHPKPFELKKSEKSKKEKEQKEKKEKPFQFQKKTPEEKKP